MLQERAHVIAALLVALVCVAALVIGIMAVLAATSDTRADSTVPSSSGTNDNGYLCNGDGSVCVLRGKRVRIHGDEGVSFEVADEKEPALECREGGETRALYGGVHASQNDVWFPRGLARAIRNDAEPKKILSLSTDRLRLYGRDPKTDKWCAVHFNKENSGTCNKRNWDEIAKSVRFVEFT